MIKIRAPRTTAAAIELLERFSLLAGQVAVAEGARNTAIADTNAVADAIVAPIVAEMDATRPVLEAWWLKDGHKLAPADRKSMELGGCDIGKKLSNKSLAFDNGDDKAALAALTEAKWAKPLIRVTYAVDKTAVRKELGGKRAADLKAMGFREHQAETFFVNRADQAGTVAA